MAKTLKLIVVLLAALTMSGAAASLADGPCTTPDTPRLASLCNSYCISLDCTGDGRGSEACVRLTNQIVKLTGPFDDSGCQFSCPCYTAEDIVSWATDAEMQPLCGDVSGLFFKHTYMVNYNDECGWGEFDPWFGPAVDAYSGEQRICRFGCIWADSATPVIFGQAEQCRAEIREAAAQLGLPCWCPGCE